MQRVKSNCLLDRISFIKRSWVLGNSKMTSIEIWQIFNFFGIQSTKFYFNTMLYHPAVSQTKKLTIFTAGKGIFFSVWLRSRLILAELVRTGSQPH